MKQYSLPKDFAEKWVAALRSGEYEQGKEALFNNGCYCCLGVAAVVCGAKNDMLLQGDDSPAAYLYRGEIDRPRIPEDVLEAIPENIIGSCGLPAKLAGFNDEGKSFADIADWIEQNVEFV